MPGSFFSEYPVYGVPIYANLAAFPASAAIGSLGVAADTGNLYEFNGTSWQLIGGPGSAQSLGNFDSQAATAKGAALVGGVLSMQSADATHPGEVNTTTQTFAGAKTFSTSVASPNLILDGATIGTLTMTVPSSVTSYALQWPGTQGGIGTFLKNDGSGGLSWAAGSGGTGVNSIGTIDSQTANSDALTITGTTLYAQSASATNPGMVNNTSQTLSGAKTFSTAPILSSLTASLPLQLDASKNIISSAIDLSGSQATGTLAAGRFPALTGDITTSAGALATTLATVNSNVGTFASVTVNGKGLVTAAAALTGDATTSGSALTLATVNTNTGSFGTSTAIPAFTVNGKGLITAASTNVVIAPAGTLTGTTLASNVVTSSLTTLGTIGTGTWNGTTVDVAHGGTGQTSYTDGQLLIGNSSGNTLTKTTLTQGSGVTITNGNGTITIAASGSATTVPTSQTFTVTGSQTGWLFNTSAWTGTIVAGDTYTNNSNTFTALATTQTNGTGQTLWMSGAGALSGTTLTKAVSASGPATITFTNSGSNILNPIPVATYTTPSSPTPLYLKIRIVGGGGGGGGGGTAGSPSVGDSGVASAFGPLLILAKSGSGGGVSGANHGVTGTGTVTSPAVQIASVRGSPGISGTVTSVATVTPPGGDGGSGPLSAGGLGADPGNNNGSAGVQGGGGGGAGAAAGLDTGYGGQAGNYIEAILSSLSSSYYYCIGTGGNGGSGGTSGGTGGAGGAGILIVEEYYQ